MAVVRRTAPDEVGFGDANVAHYAVGALAGILYVVVYLVTDAVTSDLGVADIGIDLPSHLVATMVVVVFIYVTLARLIFPHTNRCIYRERVTAARGQWFRSSLVFGATLLVPASAIFPGFA